MRRSAVLVLVVIVAVLGAGALLLTGRGPGGTPTPSPTLPPIPAATTVTADARVVPRTRVELTAPGAGGRVTQVLVAEGDRVAAGDPLLALDDRLAQTDVTAARAAVASASAAADQAKAAVKEADAAITAADAGVSEAQAAVTIADADRDAVPGGASSDARRAADAEVTRAVAALRGARAELTRARQARAGAVSAGSGADAEVDRARAGLEGALATLGQLTLSAPFAGVVAFVGPVVGDTIGAGTPVVRIADPSGWRFETTDLDEASVARITNASTATVTVDAYPDAPIAARVVSIASFGQENAGDIVFQVILEPTGATPAGLRWNMSASVSIDTGNG
jgi:membrane fusion protein (multidrug efflux system)